MDSSAVGVTSVCCSIAAHVALSCLNAREQMQLARMGKIDGTRRCDIRDAILLCMRSSERPVSSLGHWPARHGNEDIPMHCV